MSSRAEEAEEAEEAEGRQAANGIQTRINGQRSNISLHDCKYEII